MLTIIKEHRWFILFFLGVGLGSVVANTQSPITVGEVPKLLESRFEILNLQSILLQRIGLFVGLFFFSIINKNVIILYISTFYYGICAGFSISILFTFYKIQGILLFFGLILPHYCAYILVYIGFVFWHRQRQAYKRNTGNFVAIFVILGLTLLGGIFLEAYVNPWVLKEIVKNI